MPHGIPRRRFLQGLSGLAGASLGVPASLGQEAPRRLPIPPLLDARAQGGRIALVAQAGETEFWPGVASATAGYNGSYLGPTLRVHSGDEVRVRVTNRLREDTTVHWHGLLVPSEVDGGPHNTIVPGAHWEPVVPVRQAATTAWYHAHPHMRTGPQVYAGLAGLLIVTDAHERGLGLPSRYGVDDLPLVLQDKAFDRERRMVYPGGHMHAMHGVHGNAMLVNGVPRPFAQVPAGLVRLRLLNAGNARLLDVAFDDERSFHWIATEGGLLREPVALRRLSLASGQRAEVLVDFSDARAVGMVSLMAAGRSLPVMRFEPQGAPGPAAAVAPRLASWDSRPAAQTARRRRLVLGSGGMMVGGMGGMGGMGRMGMHTIERRAVRHAPHRPARAPGRHGGLGGHRHRHGDAAPLPHPRRALRGSQPRRAVAGRGRPGPARHRDRGRDRGAAGPFRPARERAGPLHVPLPHPRTRGHGDDGPVHRGLRPARGFPCRAGR